MARAKNAMRSWFPRRYARLLAGKPPRIAGDGATGGTCFTSTTLPRRLPDRALAALSGVRTINVARGESHSILDVVNTIAELVGRRGLAEQLPRSAGRLLHRLRHLAHDARARRWTFLPLAEGLRQEIAQLSGVGFKTPRPRESRRAYSAAAAAAAAAICSTECTSGIGLPFGVLENSPDVATDDAKRQESRRERNNSASMTGV